MEAGGEVARRQLTAEVAQDQHDVAPRLVIERREHGCDSGERRHAG
jgi:hypothetical protein